MRAIDVVKESGAKLWAEDAVTVSWRGEERDQARALLEHAVGGEFSDDDVIAPRALANFQRLLKRRLSGEPLPYIVGWTEFADLRLNVGTGGFIPRATTEFLAAEAVRRLRGRRSPRAIDIACGVGPVACKMAHAVPKAEVWGADIAASAVRIGRRNARDLGLANLKFVTSDMFASLPRHLRSSTDVVTMHPPYVPGTEVEDLPVEIREFEPPESLTDGSDDGMYLITRVVEESVGYLKPGGWLCLELHPSDTRKVAKLARDNGFTDVRSLLGDMKWTRVLVARYRG